MPFIGGAGQPGVGLQPTAGELQASYWETQKRIREKQITCDKARAERFASWQPNLKENFLNYLMEQFIDEYCKRTGLNLYGIDNNISRDAIVKHIYDDHSNNLQEHIELLEKILLGEDSFKEYTETSYYCEKELSGDISELNRISETKLELKDFKAKLETLFELTEENTTNMVSKITTRIESIKEMMKKAAVSNFCASFANSVKYGDLIGKKNILKAARLNCPTKIPKLKKDSKGYNWRQRINRELHDSNPEPSADKKTELQAIKSALLKLGVKPKTRKSITSLLSGKSELAYPENAPCVNWTEWGSTIINPTPPGTNVSCLIDDKNPEKPTGGKKSRKNRNRRRATRRSNTRRN